MAKAQYKAGLLFTGDSTGAVKATVATEKQLKKLNTTQKKTAKHSKKLRQQVNKLRSQFSQYSTVLTGAVIGASTLMIKSQLEQIDTLAKTADKLGITTDKLAEYRYAAELTGNDQKTFDKSLQLMIRGIAEASEGTGTAADAIKLLGLNVEDLINLSPDQQFNAIADSINKLDNQSKKVSIASDLFGARGVGLLNTLNLGSAGLSELSKEAQLAGISISRIEAAQIEAANDSITRAQTAFSGFTQQLTVEVAPIIDEIATRLFGVSTEAGGVGETATKSFDAVVKGAGVMADGLRGIEIIFTGLKIAGTGFAAATVGALDYLLSTASGNLNDIKNTLFGFVETWLTAAESLGIVSQSTVDSLKAMNDNFEFRPPEAISNAMDSLLSQIEEDKQELDNLLMKEIPSSAIETFVADVQQKSNESAKTLLENNKKTNKSLKDNLPVQTAIIKSLKDELKLTKNSAREQAIQTNLRRLGTEATAKHRQEVIELTNALFDMKEAADLKQFVKSTDELGKSWLTVGDNMESAFGSIVDQLNAISVQQKQYADSLAEVERRKKEIEKLSKTKEKEKQLKDLLATEKRLNRDNFNAKMGQLSAIAQATASGFEEGSKAARAFTVVSQGLAVAQAISAVANQGQGDPYTAFARILAMIGTMKSLGLNVGSGASAGVPLSEQRQETQGTGTVLGDASAKSESLEKAFERLEEINKNEYYELRGIFNEMVSLNRNISKFSAGLVQSFGQFTAKEFNGELNLGTVNSDLTKSFTKFNDGFGLLTSLTASILGSKKTTLEDSGILFDPQRLGEIFASGIEAFVFAEIKTKKSKLFGLSSSTKFDTKTQGLNAEFSQQLTSIFESLGASVNSALDILGLDAANSLDNFIVNIGKISLKDLSGEEIQKELEAVISRQGDLMAGFVLPSLTEFQQIGEGLFDTLIRVSQEQVVFNSTLNRLGLELVDLNALETITVAQDIIEMIGGLEKFQDATNEYFTSFYSESEQFEFLQKNLVAQFSEAGFVLTNTREDFRNLIDSLDLTTEAGQEAFAVLMSMVPALSTYYDKIEAQKKAVTEFNESIQHQLDGFGLSEIQKKIRSLNDEFKKHIEEALPGADIALLEKLYAKKREEIVESHLVSVNAKFDKLGDAISSVAESIDSAILKIRQSNSNWDEVGYQNGIIENLYSQLEQVISVVTPELPVFEVPTPLPPRYDIIRPPGDNAITPHPPEFEEFTNVVSLFVKDIAAIGAEAEQVVTSINTDIDVSKQISIIKQLQEAIVARYQAELKLIDEQRDEITDRQAEIKSEIDSLTQDFESAVSQFNQTFEQITDSIVNTSASISDAILAIQRGQSGWNEVAYQQDKIANLREQLGQGSIEEQIGRIGELQQAITARYNAELSQSQKLESESKAYAQQQFNNAKKLHQEQVQNYKRLNGLAKKLNGYLDSLKLSNLSYLTNDQRFLEAQNQYQKTLSKAVAGDESAISALQGVANSYLKESQSYYASSQNYTDIFDNVSREIAGVVGGLDVGSAGEFNEAVHAAAVESYQSQQVSLQEDSIAELQNLETLLAELQAQASENLDSNIGNLTDEYNNNIGSLELELTIQSDLLAALDLTAQSLEASTIAELQSLKTKLAELELLNEENRINAIADLKSSIEQQTIDIVTAIQNENNNSGNTGNTGNQSTVPVEPTLPIQSPVIPPKNTPSPGQPPKDINFQQLERMAINAERRAASAEQKTEQLIAQNAELIKQLKMLNRRTEETGNAIVSTNRAGVA